MSEEVKAICMSCRHGKLFHSEILKETFMVCTKNMLDESFVDIKSIGKCSKFRPKCRHCAFDRKIGLFHKCMLGGKKTACTCYSPLDGYEYDMELDDEDMINSFKNKK